MIPKQSNSLKILFVLGFCALDVAFAQSQTWTVREYGDPNNPWTSEDGPAHPCGCVIVQGGDDKLITISANPSYELKFEIYYADPNGVYQSEAPLNDFTIDSAVDAELIEVRIARDTDDDSPGATNVGAINLTNDQGASLTGNLAELRITGNFATTGSTVLDDVTGNIDVEGSVATGATVGPVIERQSQILELIRGGARLRVPGFAERLRCSYTTAKREVDALKAEGRIEFVGPSRTGYYRLAAAASA